jgi:protein-tyrosine kinase
MSRVFEALAKATEQKQTQANGSQGELGNSSADSAQVCESVHILDILDDPKVNGSAPANGHQRDFPTAPLTVKNAGKSWRERIEELVFGWDLGRYQKYPIVSLEKDSAASQQYKMLREQIKRLHIDGGIETFSITSPIKRDGKTTVAVNLAAALALDYEEQVLLIDGDLRAPGVHRYFNAPLSPGLSDYLSSPSNVSVTSLIRKTFVAGLQILPAGKTSHLSSELLAKDEMKRLMDKVRSEFPGHKIIIDSPPILSTPDPIVIARLVDGVLLVIRAEKTPREYLTKALQALNARKLMGIVLNGANMGISSKYYYYTADGSY